MSRSNDPESPKVTEFFDSKTNTFSYVVEDSKTATCAIIDSVLDLDYPSGTISHESANEIIEYISNAKLNVEWILETHIHADHLSAAPYLREMLGGKIAIGEQVTTIQKQFGTIFNEDSKFERNGSQFDVLLTDHHSLNIGSVNGYVLHTPGHTPACMTYVFGDAVFVGDTLFMPDSGTARADFPGGDARQLYRSIQKILSLPENSRVFVCHDYMPNGRKQQHETTIAEQAYENIHLGSEVSENDYVKMRMARDASLSMPTLILPSIQVNMRAGHLPVREAGSTYLKIPINVSGKSNASKTPEAT